MRKLTYFLRTDGVDREARIEKFFGFLTERQVAPHLSAFVQYRADFPFGFDEVICTAERLPIHMLRLAAKLIELQGRAMWSCLRKTDRQDVIVFGNYEFLPAAVFVSLLLRRKVFVDLHEHYHRRLFGSKRLNRFLFTRVLTGVVFANPARARDFLGKNALDNPAVVIARNYPGNSAGTVATPRYSARSGPLKFGIIGGYRPGRFVAESLEALDQPEFSGLIELSTIGPPLKQQAEHIMFTEHGTFKHGEVDAYVKSIDVSLVFYDTRRSSNNLFAEPNRYFQSYNAGKIILCFQHPTLSDLIDEYCRVIEIDNFAENLRRETREILTLANDRHDSSREIVRRKTTYEEGVHNWQVLVQ